MKGLPKTLAVNEKELCKYFEPGNHVKIVSGAQEGATGMVVKVEGHVLIILSDTTKENIRVFADDVVESSEVTSGVTRIGDYELHDLVLLDNMSFGVIIRIESEAFQVLKGVPDRREVALVKLREIKCKIEKRVNVQDRFKNTVAVKDVVRILEGPCRGDSIASRFAHLRTPPRIPQSPMRLPRGGPPMNSGGRNRGGRGHDSLVGSTVKVLQGPYKGYRGQTITASVCAVDRNQISDNVAVATLFCDAPRYGMGSETPMHPSRTPLHPYMTPMRDPGAKPIHDGMRTPMRDKAWNPYTPMSPPRDNWEDGNPDSWATSPQYQPGSPPSRIYEAPTPGSGWANTPGGSYSDAGTPRDSTPTYANAPSPYLPSTPGGQPMTPNSASYLPGTPGGQPMTLGTGGLDAMSPIGVDNEGPWFMPDILVNLRRAGEDTAMGVIREVLPDGSCRVGLGSNGNGEMVTALPNEIEIVVPRKSDKIKIISGLQCGTTGKLIGVDGTDGIVKVDDTLDVKILEMFRLAKQAQP
ncbi:hypothetical protein L1049_026705 [Liquidambar formosana]|uniref:KOW domain-containing protein n=1 Tax=Liquidambar formosana TaxID=63359 RepID=A0AAP0NFG1_LIQFO